MKEKAHSKIETIEHNKENTHSCVCYEKNIELIEKGKDGCYNENV